MLSYGIIYIVGSRNRRQGKTFFLFVFVMFVLENSLSLLLYTANLVLVKIGA